MFNHKEDNPYTIRFSIFQLSRNLGTRIVVPFLSIILLEANWESSQITAFFALFSLAGFLFSPIIGKISDKTGRKPLIAGGLVLQSIFFLTYFFFTTPYLLYTARFLEGIAYATISIISLSAFEDLIKRERGYWTGMLMSIGTIGTLLGPVVAGFIAERYFTKAILLISIIFYLFSLLIMFFIPEKTTTKQKITLHDINPFTEIKEFLSYKKLKGMGFLGFLMNGKNEFFTIFFPIFLVQSLNLPKHYVGIAISVSMLFKIFQFYYGKIGDKISAEFGTLLGVFLVSITLFFLPYIPNFTLLLLLLVLFGIGGGIWNVNAWTLMSNVASKEKIEGEVVGSYQSISKIGMFIAASTSSYILKFTSIEFTFQIFSLIILVGIAVAYMFLKPIMPAVSQNTKL